MIGNATIDYGHADASAVEGIGRGGYVGFDRARKLLGRRIRCHRYRTAWRDVGDVWIIRQFCQHTDRHTHGDRPNRLEFRPDECPTTLHSLKMCTRRHHVMLHDHRDHLTRALMILNVARELAGCTCVAVQNRPGATVGWDCAKSEQCHSESSAPPGAERWGAERTLSESVVV